ncbi:MAG: transposase, partial [Phycisphaerae bacterium]|nr:transposase [Phycisphaerae bacterium]
MLLAALNRACDPCSKLQIGPWYQQTILSRVWKVTAEAFTSQQFRYVMGRVTDEAIAAIEKDLVDKL